MSMINTTHPRQVAKQSLINGVAKIMVNDTMMKRSGWDWPDMIPLGSDEPEKDLMLLAVLTVKQSILWKPGERRWVATVGDIEYFSEKC